MTLHVETFTHEPFQVNTYLIWEEEGRTAFLVDVGRNVEPILKAVETHQLILEDVFHTHGFIEFLEGQPALREHFDLTAHMNPLDEFWLAHLDTQATILNVETVPQAFVNQQILPGDRVRIGPVEITALETPGNSPGGLSFWVPAARAVFVGDVLYAGAIGPTDIPHGNLERLRAGIRNQLFTLPEETVVYPGRGPVTTIGQEKRANGLESRPYGTRL